YRGANWHERETHEMFGIEFIGHPNLVRLLLPDDFQGRPLRKDFVLASRAAKPWPGAVNPGESTTEARRSRKPKLPPGVPAPGEWGGGDGPCRDDAERSDEVGAPPACGGERRP
ncbi:MAG: NADH-quinone oxidoreductase subunit C, partial [Actinomycetes bacterium]